jgi:hypothetical protein
LARLLVSREFTFKENEMADKVNLQKSYSALNESLAKTFDESGVDRSFTVPYIDGQGMDEHVAAVGNAAAQSGGLTNNLLTTMHHSEGKGWGSGDGHTVGHPSDALRSTILPDDDENAKATIKAAQKHLNNIASLLGDDDPAIKLANGQLDLVKKTDGAGMNLLDFGVMMTQIMYGPNQAIARAHQGTKPGGHSPSLSAPGDSSQSQPDQPQGQPADQSGAPAAPDAQGGAPAASAAPDASAAPQNAPQPAAGAPVQPQAQG